MTLDVRQGIAARLGLPPEAVSVLERHGLLGMLDLDDAEIRERLWEGHMAFVQGERLAAPATAAELLAAPPVRHEPGSDPVAPI